MIRILATVVLLLQVCSAQQPVIVDLGLPDNRNTGLDQSSIAYISDTKLVVHVRTQPPPNFKECSPNVHCAVRPEANPQMLYLVDAAAGTVARKQSVQTDRTGSKVFIPGPAGTFFLRTATALEQWNSDLRLLRTAPVRPGRFGANISIAPSRRYIAVPLAQENENRFPVNAAVLDTSDLSIVGSIEAKALVGDGVYLGRSGIACWNEPCTAPKYPAHLVSDDGGLIFAGPAILKALRQSKSPLYIVMSQDGQRVAAFASWCTGAHLNIDECKKRAASVTVFDVQSGRELFVHSWSEGISLLSGQLALSNSGNSLAVWQKGTLLIWNLPVAQPSSKK